MVNLLLKKYISEKRVIGTLREDIEQLSADDASALARVVEKTNPSANTLREIVRLAREISARDAKSLNAVLNTDEISQALKSSELSNKAKQQRLRNCLERERYPERKRIEAELRDCQQQLLSDCGLRVSLPLELEGDKLTVKFEASSVEELVKRGEQVNRLSIHPKTKKIFQILKGLE